MADDPVDDALARGQRTDEFLVQVGAAALIVLAVLAAVNLYRQSWFAFALSVTSLLVLAWVTNTAAHRVRTTREVRRKRNGRAR